jgi:hypothetical protein
MSNNKITTVFTVPFAYSVAGNQAFNASCLDELMMYANDMTTVAQSAGVASQSEFDIYYIPENLTSGAEVTFFENGVRQDVKRKVATRLPRVTLGQGLVILSAQDNMGQYFINSVLHRTACGFIRVGIANFTSDFATNPFGQVDANLNLQAVWGFFDLGEPVM